MSYPEQMITFYLTYLAYLIGIVFFAKLTIYPLRRCYNTISELFTKITESKTILELLLTTSKFLLGMAGLVAGIWGGIVLGVWLSSYFGINSLLGIAAVKLGGACWVSAAGAIIGTVPHLLCEKLYNCCLTQRNNEEWENEDHGIKDWDKYLLTADGHTPPSSPSHRSRPSSPQARLTDCKAIYFQSSTSSPSSLLIAPQHQSTNRPGQQGRN